jgi:hypothetical protein
VGLLVIDCAQGMLTMNLVSRSVICNRKPFPSDMAERSPTKLRARSSKGCVGTGHVVRGACGWAAGLRSWQWRQDRT